MDELKRTCGKFFAFSNLSMYCYSNEINTLFYFPEYYSEMRTDFVKDCVLKMEVSDPERRKPLVLTMDSRYHFAVIPLQQKLTLLVGPVALHPEGVAFLPIYNVFSNRHKCADMSYEKFLNAVSLLAELCTGNSCEINELIPMEAPMMDPMMDMESNELLPSPNLKISYTGEALEQRLLTLIEKGNVEELKKQLEFPSYVTIESMSSNPLQHQKYLFIVFMTMAVRAAIRGGLDDEKAFGIVGHYCIRMDNCSQVKDITSLIYHMALSLCREVHKHSVSASLSSTMRRCCAFITANLYAPLNLTKLAQALNISTRNLCSRFQKELGVTPMAYVQSARIEEARFLLKYTNHSLLEISTALHFSSQSHFTSVFRRITGMTPKRYQETIMA
ncbi:AraC-type DNA-binding protein [Evansella caseinilytica]|uniref:AraC-type DNA-binding protein n=1 Tax=Evansella caseinilytica TaxID=1503961 RepID=A0A1H3U4Y5_9BACI|nr:AraC family transcriptional regulator [Evansella caseinilytica]SDZ57536.1 AraC-type DNA-binding protein [Evansella caseinilytica]